MGRRVWCGPEVGGRTYIEDCHSTRDLEIHCLLGSVTRTVGPTGPARTQHFGRWTRVYARSQHISGRRSQHFAENSRLFAGGSQYYAGVAWMAHHFAWKAKHTG